MKEMKRLAGMRPAKRLCALLVVGGVEQTSSLERQRFLVFGSDATHPTGVNFGVVNIFNSDVENIAIYDNKICRLSGFDGASFICNPQCFVRFASKGCKCLGECDGLLHINSAIIAVFDGSLASNHALNT